MGKNPHVLWSWSQFNASPGDHAKRFGAGSRGADFLEVWIKETPLCMTDALASLFALGCLCALIS